MSRTQKPHKEGNTQLIPPATMEEENTAALRLYVGGLGERVTEEDINKTFCNLGVVQSVDIIRTKGRSFAYINFLPSSNNSLPKLFSTYNGCAWKGGKLKLEKAKEHYLDRLKREWAEEAELKDKKHLNQDDADVSVESPDPQSTLDLKDMEFRVFFPKLRKVKPLPLSGTGKHKYSFRRLEAPPVPVHFCDCPEHSVPVQTRAVTRADDTNKQKFGINRKEYNLTTSGKNRFLRQETSSGHKKAVVHDSIIQDDGMNEEEIHMMDSVMKKLLERRTSSKKDQKNFQLSQEITTLNSEIQETKNDIDDKIEDDDDIKINAVSVENFSSFSSGSVERPENLQNDETDEVDDETDEVDDEADDDDIQINAVYRRNKRQTSLANEITRLNQRTESSIRKRNSVSIETNISDMTSPFNEKKGLLSIPSKKPAWKQLVGDSSSSSFTLSQITSENDTNLEKQPKLGKKASSDKKIKRVSFTLPVESTPGDEPPAGSKELEEDNNGVLRDSQLSQHNKKSKKICQAVLDEPKSSDELPAVGEEHDVAKNFVETGPSAQHDELSNGVEKVAFKEPKLSDEISDGSKEHDAANNLTPGDSTPLQRNKKRKKACNVASKEPPAGIEDCEVANKLVKTDQSVQNDEKDRPPVSQGSSWLQKSTWMQLTGGGNDSSFSISQILPGDLVQNQNSQKPDDISTVNFFSTGGAFSKGQRASEMMSDGSPREMEVSKAAEGTDLCNSSTKTVLDPRTETATSYSIRGVQISESCPFMRNADSMKEWKTAKTSMSNSLKKMKNKE